MTIFQYTAHNKSQGGKPILKKVKVQTMEKVLVFYIRKETEKHNKHNVSRTKAYQDYYTRNREITWAYLASMVSRNAGWSMSDLWSIPYRKLLTKEKANHIFTTYERANWMIFSDAYPQLVIYEWSKKMKKPLFHLLKQFHVSEWMIQEWYHFWQNSDKKRLLYALIINEQHLIQQPVIESVFFKNNIFRSLDYIIQEKLHFSFVLFPTTNGELYGRTIKHFSKVEKRIELGIHLAWVLLDSPVKSKIHDFFNMVAFSGSRKDYQQFSLEKFYDTPFLLEVYPFIYQHDEQRIDWSKDPTFSPNKLLHKNWRAPNKIRLTDWYKKKQQQIVLAASVYSIFHKDSQDYRE